MIKKDEIALHICNQFEKRSTLRKSTIIQYKSVADYQKDIAENEFEIEKLRHTISEFKPKKQKYQHKKHSSASISTKSTGFNKSGNFSKANTVINTGCVSAVESANVSFIDSISNNNTVKNTTISSFKTIEHQRSIKNISHFNTPVKKGNFNLKTASSFYSNRTINAESAKNKGKELDFIYDKLNRGGFNRQTKNEVINYLRNHTNIDVNSLLDSKYIIML